MSQTIACRDLVVAYGSHVAADHVNFSVDEGEIFGLLGPNGAGKTSVIRALTTILEPAQGTATVAGFPLEFHREIRRLIGVLPESSGYPRAQTGLAYLTFYGQLFELSKATARERARRLLAQFGLGETTQHVSKYSRGMRQRLGLCRSMMNSPQVLFLDEPTLGLDPAGKENIMRALVEIATEQGTTVVLCTHLLDEVERVCDRVAIMNDGDLIAEGTVDQIVDRADLAGEAILRVAPDDIVRLLDSMPRDATRFDNTRPGEIVFALPSASNGDDPAQALLRAAIATGVQIHAFERHKGSLNDAFLALTNRTPITQRAS